MSALTYNLDGGAHGDFQSFVHAQHYTDAFEQALMAKANDELTLFGRGEIGNVDLQNMDDLYEAFKPGRYDGAYVSTFNGIDTPESQASLDKARYILFKGDLPDTDPQGDGVDVVLSGKKEHIIGLTQGDDSLMIGGKANQLVDGGEGNDIIQTGRGNDTVYGGEGDDELHGGRGNDVLFGGGGEDTVDGGWGFDVGVVTGAKADFHFVAGEWVNQSTGEHIQNVEIAVTGTPGDDSVLITVSKDADAELARLFQAIADQDPTAEDYMTALKAFHGGAKLDAIASVIGDNLINDDLKDTLTNDIDKKAFVTEIIHNLYDGTAGEWNAGKIDDYVQNHSQWEKAKVVADLVHKVADADDHIGIAIDHTSH